MSRVTVLGASGGLGQAIATELAGRGHEVTGTSRTGNLPVAGVRSRPADLHDLDDARAACAHAQVVVMAAGLPYRQWATRFSSMIDNVVTATAEAGARLVMVDNLYAYGCPDGPISTDTAEAATTIKGAIRREIAQRLRKAHRTGTCKVAIGRVSDYYGPGGTNTPVYILGFKPALAGRRLRALINANQPHTFHYLPDAARGFATLVDNPEADGHTWILPAAPPIAQRVLLTHIATTASAPTRLSRVSPTMLTLAGLVSPDLRELRELTCQWDRPYTIDATAFENAFGPITTTPHDHAVTETLAAFRNARLTRARRAQTVTTRH
jgi:nucleoside-diphosphate-sugar epimerase